MKPGGDARETTHYADQVAKLKVRQAESDLASKRRLAHAGDPGSTLVVLGVDPSLTGTGLAWLESPSGDRMTARLPNPARATADVETQTAGVILKGEPLPMGYRLSKLRSDLLCAVCDNWTPMPCLAVVESGFSGGQGPVAIKLGMVMGQVLQTLWDLYIPVITVAPTQRAKFATGNGNADKEEVLRAAMILFGLDEVPPEGCTKTVRETYYDRADAMVLAHMGGYAIGEDFEIPGFDATPKQLKALEAMEEINLDD